MAGLIFSGVRKDYGKVRALRKLDLEVREGEFMVIVGPSGSGKTSALRIAAGLEEVTAGSVVIRGRDVTRLPPAKRNVAMVFQSYALFPHLSVAENIGFGLTGRGIPKKKVATQVRGAARIVGCGRLLHRKPSQLSGGERQRVALARALARHPDVFLLDEPLSNLDAQLRVSMRTELKALHQRLEATMVYVTHDQIEALTLGDRVAVIDRGIVQQVGRPDQIYRRPANRFVAGFIGSPAMNFLSATLRDGRLRAGPFEFRPRASDRGLRRRRLEVGIRPEHIEVVPDGRSGVDAQIHLVDVAGSETFVHLAAGKQELVARVRHGVRPKVGATVRLKVRRAHTHLFDAHSGVALRAG